MRENIIREYFIANKVWLSTKIQSANFFSRNMLNTSNSQKFQSRNKPAIYIYTSGVGSVLYLVHLTHSPLRAYIVYRLLGNSRFLQILNLISYHTIFQDFMDSNNHFSWFYKLPSDFSPYTSQCICFNWHALFVWNELISLVPRLSTIRGGKPGILSHVSDVGVDARVIGRRRRALD